MYTICLPQWHMFLKEQILDYTETETNHSAVYHTLWASIELVKKVVILDYSKLAIPDIILSMFSESSQRTSNWRQDIPTYSLHYDTTLIILPFYWSRYIKCHLLPIPGNYFNSQQIMIFIWAKFDWFNNTFSNCNSKFFLVSVNLVMLFTGANCWQMYMWSWFCWPTSGNVVPIAGETAWWRMISDAARYVDSCSDITCICCSYDYACLEASSLTYLLCRSSENCWRHHHSLTQLRWMPFIRYPISLDRFVQLCTIWTLLEYLKNSHFRTILKFWDYLVAG